MTEVTVTIPIDGRTGTPELVSYHAIRTPPQELESLHNTLSSESTALVCNGSLCTPTTAIRIQPAAVISPASVNGNNTSAAAGDIQLRKVPNGSPSSGRKPMMSLTHLPKRPTVDIQFEDLSYQVSEGRRKGYKTILKGVNGKFRSGELTAIMGPSGAGKSTLMNILAGYKSKNLTGSVTINGRTRNLRRFRKMSAYIMQDDCLTPHLTVKEAMKVAANLKLGKDVSPEKNKIVIEEILETLNLQECEDTYTLNLSGGQRKRLSIALELVNNPPVMFFDEPTSGLDSSSCFQCISLMKSLARGGRTIICTIHQPSARLFELFDNLYMMAEGQCIYKGQVQGLVPFLSTMGLYCPSYHNPADYVMEVACGEHGEYVEKLVIAVKSGHCDSYREKTPDSLCNSICTNDIAKTNAQITTPSVISKDTTVVNLTLNIPNGSINKNGKNSSQSTNIDSLKDTDKTNTPNATTSLLDTSSSENLALEDNTSFPTSGFRQFWILLKRTVFTILRDQTLTRMRLIAHFIIGCLLGLIYYNIGNDAGKVMSNAGCIFFTIMFAMFSSMMPTILTFPLEMSVFVREHLNYWYSLKAYYFAKTLADIPFQILLTAAFILGVYYLTAQPMEATRFAMMLLISVLTALVSQSLGLLVGAAFNLEGGVFLGPISIIPMVLFSGFFANLNDIPKYLSWISYVSYVRYSFEGAMISIYGLDREKLLCEEIYCHYKYPKTFLKQLSLNGDMTSYLIDVGALIGFFLVVRISTFFVLRIKLMSLR